MKLLPEQDFQRLIADGKIIERDGNGPKVIGLPNDRYFKAFYHKSWFSASHLISRAQQFSSNANKLKQHGFNTVAIENVFKLAAPTRHCIIYRGVPGSTVRQTLEKIPRDIALSQQVGAYVAALHNKGVMFRSLHMGNVIAQPDGELALIDIADMRVNWFSLNRWQRKRNFQHVFRYACDKKTLNLEAFVEGYCLEKSWRGFSRNQLRNLIEHIQPKAEH